MNTPTMPTCLNCGTVMIAGQPHFCVGRITPLAPLSPATSPAPSNWYPPCGLCGAAVADWQKHIDWHVSLNPPVAVDVEGG